MVGKLLESEVEDVTENKEARENFLEWGSSAVP